MTCHLCSKEVISGFTGATALGTSAKEIVAIPGKHDIIISELLDPFERDSVS